MAAGSVGRHDNQQDVDGGGDGQSWGDANNWSGGTVPAASDSIFIGGTNGTITASGGLTVSNLICQCSLTVNGSMTVSGAVDIGQSFYIPAGNSISVSGTNAMLIAEGSTTAYAASMYVQQGSLISLPSLTNYFTGKRHMVISRRLEQAAWLTCLRCRQSRDPAGRAIFADSSTPGRRDKHERLNNYHWRNGKLGNRHTNNR